MFELSEETRKNIIAVLRERLDVTKTDEEINSAIDELVNVVKSQFGF
jgi:CheY-specific phosphatase CheX